MRNNAYRTLLNDIAEKVNECIKEGVEPLAIAIALRNMADQCDRLAEEFEKQEKEAKNKESEEKVNG